MTIVNESLNILISWTAISTIVLLFGTSILFLMRQPVEKIRCIQWTLAAILVAFVLRHSASLPTWSVEILPPSTTPATTAAPTMPDSLPVSADASRATGPPISVTDGLPVGRLVGRPVGRPVGRFEEAGSSTSRWTTGALMKLGCLVAYVVGGIASALLLLIGWIRLRRILHAARPAEESLLVAWSDRDSASRRRTKVLVSDQIDVPVTSGILKPVIVLPARLLEANDGQSIRFCLAHEWAHVRNRDIATWWAVHGVQILLWFHPLLWYLRRELRTAQDQLADDYAAGESSARADYAELLVGLAGQRSFRGGGLALSMAEGRSTLYRRVRMLLTPSWKLNQQARRRVLWSTGIGIATVVLALGAVRLEPTTADDEVDAQAEPATEPGALSYSGFVVDKRTQEPIVGATVVVRRMILKSNQRKIIEESSHLTDAVGRYEFVLPPEQVVPYMYIEIDVEHPDYAWKKGFGYALGMIRKNERLGEKPFFAHIELYPGEPVTGRVVNRDGDPIAGAPVQSYSKSNADDFRDYGSFFQAKTDADGRFKLQMVKGGPSYFWIVPEHHAAVQVVSGTKRGEWGDIPVDEGVATSGQVVNATGQPVAGVWVNLEDQDSEQEITLPVASSMNRSCLTDEDGRFSLGPMKPGKYRIGVGDYPRELKYFKRGRSPIEVDDVFVSRELELTAEDADRPLILQAVPHVEFHGQYLDSEGKQRSGHAVSVWGYFDESWYHTSLRPDKNGKISGKLPHGLTKARLQTITNEHGALRVRLTADGELQGGREFDLGTIEDDINDVEIVRYTAAIVQLKPVDEQGNVVRGCTVSGIYSDGKQATMTPVGGRPTNLFFEEQKDGRFRTSQMLPDQEVTFTVTADGYDEAETKITLSEGQEKEVVVVLSKS